MKNLSFFLVVVAMISCTNKQKIGNNTVPATVMATLQKEFPSVNKINWERKENNYEVGFENGENQYSVLINSAGNIIETEIEISPNVLPAAVKAYVVKNYPRQKIKEAAKITDGNGVATYEVEIKNKNIILDGNGNFVKHTKP